MLIEVEKKIQLVSDPYSLLNYITFKRKIARWKFTNIAIIYKYNDNMKTTLSQLLYRLIK